ncbi:MAG: N-acetyl-gamma-glutamyl-phosphate reductase [Alicyclobacillaceae bacterium]|nr:N-acetyl-gamma-glutamyl-phosphate reductase [Alicyclobacillaceae bacterium]
MVVTPPVRAGIIGVTGYSGTELLRILLHHPHLEVTYLAARQVTAATPVGTLLPSFAACSGTLLVHPFCETDCVHACDVVFVALPSGVSGDIALSLSNKGVVVIDLSGDLRLPKEVYEQWYPHRSPLPADQAPPVYGLSEWFSHAVTGATLVSNPGCYATAVELALLPIVQSPWMDARQSVVVDAKSGTTGAGKSPAAHLTFSEMTENFLAYRVGRHQHLPEIEQTLTQLTGKSVSICMTTQLLPVARGIFATCYVPLVGPVSDLELRTLYEDAYRETVFVSMLPPGSWPDLHSVRGTNQCLLSIHVDARNNMLQVFSVIDNLQKGAAGQAVQNCNRIFGWPEISGLSVIASAL